jgi:formate--tetrahydrofolate ligase
MNLKNIKDIGNKINLEEDDLFCYGNYKAKILKNYEDFNNEDGKLILVTSINPTPYGEGKTTLSIGLNDSLNKLGKKSIVTLREPSLGPVFGRKGGAIGGGKAKIEPELDINLHFNGDFHAVTSANNLLCAIIDNHIYEGNKLKIDRVTFKRCLDINDRELRYVNLKSRQEEFVITPASEIMAIVCLSKNLMDLKERIGNIIVGYTKDNKEICAKDLNAQESLTILLKDAINPNLVQTLYNNPAIVHGGPFANIAHGCSSLLSTKLALKLSDYTITEAGFGSDMGGIKFFDIKARNNDIDVYAVVINVTIKSLKYNGNGVLEDGFEILEFHIENMKKFNDNVIVALNRFEEDTILEINMLQDYCTSKNIDFEICEMYLNGEDGCISLAEKIINLKENKKTFNIYDDNDDIYVKIEKVCSLYGCNKVNYTDKAKEKIELLDKEKYKNMKICISKTPSSITDNPKQIGYIKDFSMTVTDINVYNGAGFIVVYMGNVLTMPGLSKDSKYLNMYIDDNIIKGI